MDYKTFQINNLQAQNPLSLSQKGMEHILDDNTDHLKAREEKLVKRRKVFWVLIFILPIPFSIFGAFEQARQGDELIGQIFSLYIGSLMIFGLLGLVIGNVLSWLIWKDVNTRIRRRYLVSVSTMVLHAIFAVITIINTVFLLLGWIKL